MGAVAHGGFCVARVEGRAVFVRHALPGEQVRARVTEGAEGSRYLRADAVEILEASPDRVPPACPHSGPGRCGGCDWQHASTDAVRRLKGEVVAEQLQRLAGLELAVLVEPVAGDRDGLGWRTRVRHSVDAEGRLGFHRHRSNDVYAVDSCPISHPRVAETGHLQGRWGTCESVDVVAPASSQDRLVVLTPRGPSVPGRRSVPPVDGSVVVAGPSGLTQLSGRTWVREQVSVRDWTREFRVSGPGFWQVHPGAPTALTEAVLDQLEVRPGERALDLYSGVGLFAAALAEEVGVTGAVTAVEGDRRAVADARRNLHDLPQVALHHGDVRRALPSALASLPGGGADVVVLDPPRSGAGQAVVAALCAAGPRAVSYVACDPAALARDVAWAADGGYRLAALRAFDLFPMTQHVECVALLVPVDGG